MSSSHEISHTQNPRQLAFLEAYARCGTITHAAKSSGIDRRTHYDWLENDATYGGRFAEAHERAKDSLVKEARRRAIRGWLEPVFHEGSVCGHKRKFSDTLLIFLMKGEIPEKFSDKITQPDPQKHLHVHVDGRSEPDEEARRTLSRYLQQITGTLDGGSNGSTNGNGAAA